MIFTMLLYQPHMARLRAVLPESLICVVWVSAMLSLLPGCSEQSPSTPDSSNNQANQSETALEHAAKHLTPRYVCPMHPQIVHDVQGTCPLCGMDLVKQQIDNPPQSDPVVSIDPGTMQKTGIRTASVTRGDIWKIIKTVGYVDYNEDRLAHVETRTYGWVENLAVRREGLSVKKGQLLLEQYAPEFLEVQKDFLAAQKKDKSGILKKYGQRAESVAPRDYLRYLDISESAINEIAQTGKAKHRIPIYAPIYGEIIRHNVHKHMFVPAEYTMFTIADLSSVWVEADVFEYHLEWVKRGLRADVIIQALPGQQWEGHVKYIYPELDSQTRTLRVRLLVPNPDGILKPNMFAQVTIYGGPKREVLKIPREALIMTGERELVIVERETGKFQPHEVVSGIRSRGEVEITKGLKEGDRVVVSGQFLIDSEANLQASLLRFSGNQE